MTGPEALSPTAQPSESSADDAGRGIVSVRGLRCAYGDVEVLREVSFDVHRGEVFVILGGSGCGKSTLLRHLIGLLEPTHGTIRIDGVEMTTAGGDERLALLRRFGVLFQSGAMFSGLTLAENLALPLEEFTELPSEAIRELCERKLALVGLGGYGDYLPDEISGGMRKRAGVARALALDPPLLFFDEPSAGLDPISSASLDRLILDLRDALGTTMVIVTHELASIYAVADRCIMLDKERRTIVARGRPQDLRDGSEDPFVRAFFRREDEVGAGDVGASADAASTVEGA